MKTKYRIQYADQDRFATWSEWRDIEDKIIESDILSVQISEYVTNEEYVKFMEQFNETPSA